MSDEFKAKELLLGNSCANCLFLKRKITYKAITSPYNTNQRSHLLNVNINICDFYHFELQVKPDSNICNQYIQNA